MIPEDLKNIAYEINTQDNRITADPLFCVFEKEKIYGFDSDYADTFKWCDSESGRILHPGEITEEKAEQDGYEKVYYVEQDRFVNAHFTEKAANEHIRINGHNLQEPFVFVTSLFRCEEMIKIRKALASKDIRLISEDKNAHEKIKEEKLKRLEDLLKNDETKKEIKMSEFKKYTRKGFSEMRPYISGEDLSDIPVADIDTPEEGGMVARNPKNHEDQWYVAKQYFEDNLELAE